MDSAGGSRRSSFGTYNTTATHEAHFTAKSVSNPLNKGFHGGSLGNIPRAAKERLDERLRSQRGLEIKRNNSTGSMRPVDQRGGSEGALLGSVILGNVQREVFCSNRRSRKFSWSKLGWKSAEQDDECVVCLEELKTGDILVHLPCAHRFHWNCVVPWLESTSHCPCCRMNTFT